jgi:hypothetical protein
MSTVVDLGVQRQKRSLRRIEQLGVSTRPETAKRKRYFRFVATLEHAPQDHVAGAQNAGDHRLTQEGGPPPTIKEQVGRWLRPDKLEDGR